MAVFLSYWHHFIFLLLVSCLEVISSLVVSSTDDCIPRCCAQGQILDHTGTRCLRDLSREYIPDPCGRRDSFLPTCESREGSEEGYATHLYTLLEPRTYFPGIFVGNFLFTCTICISSTYAHKTRKCLVDIFN